MRDLRSRSRRVVVRDVDVDVDVSGGGDGDDDDGGGKREGGGEVVSYALWEFFVGRGDESVGEKREEGGGGDGASWPPDANGEALGVLVEMGRRKREGIMGERDYACKSMWTLSYYGHVCYGRQLRVSSLINVSSLLYLLISRLAYFGIRYAISLIISQAISSIIESNLTVPIPMHQSPRKSLYSTHPPPARCRLPTYKMGSRSRRRPSTPHLR